MDEFVEGMPRRKLIGIRWIVVFRIGDRLYALEDRCPHEGTPLSIGTPSGMTVRCRSHGLAFDLESGVCAANDDFQVRNFRVHVRKGKVWVTPARVRRRHAPATRTSSIRETR
ncbi:MAG: Rieske (2Fe-2S) protein [Actinomycetota bacterium]